MSQAGLLLMAVAGLWIAYLVPHRLRYRQQLLECRTEDRFSEHLRVVRVARANRTGAPTGRQVAVRTGRVLLHPAAGRGGGSVDRPLALAGRVVADAVRRSAAERAQRAAHLARRRAGARRRVALAVTLVLLTAAGWAGVAVGGLLVVAAAAPTTLLALVLVLGRRAVVLGRRADAAWAAGRATPVVAPTVVGHAVHPSDASTEVMARIAAGPSVAVGRRVPAEAAAAGGERQAVASSGGTTWVPVPVPRPAYALKPAVRRAEPAPLVLDVEDASVVQTPEHVERPVTRGIDLDAVLARRRAAGE